MKKKIIKYLLIIFMISFLFMGVTAKADTGPKPTTHITFEDIPDSGIYVTLFAKNESHGPWNTEYIELENEIDEKFYEYSLSDDFYFWGNVNKITKDSDTYNWIYYPPATFKIVYYNELNNTFYKSEEINRYAFNSYFKMNLSDNSIEKNYNYLGEVLHFLLRVVVTIGIELLLAFFVFKFKKKSFLIIVITNIITQILLNVLLNIFNYHDGSLKLIINYILYELFIVIFESIIYLIFIPKTDKEKPYPKSGILLYTILANIASFVLGLLIFMYVPGLS